MDGNGNPQVGDDAPGMRGGHQMVIDPVRGLIYLLGGWDGSVSARVRLNV